MAPVKKEGAVSINIVNWNGLKYLPACLKSIRNQVYDGEIEIIVVDNASSDGSRELLEKEFTLKAFFDSRSGGNEGHPEGFPKIKLVKNPGNVGFCVAHNQAIRLSESEYVLPLNFDIILEPEFLAEMVMAMKQDERVGMVSGKLYKILDGNRADLLDSTGIIMPFYWSAARGEMCQDEGQFDSAEHRYIFGPCGCAPLYRREMLEDIKVNGEYFDEDFVNYVEDVDLAWRAQLLGWKAVYTPQAVAYHERGATRKGDKEVHRDYYLTGFRNRYWAILKNVTRGELKENFGKMLLREAAFLMYRKDGLFTPRTSFAALFRALKKSRVMLNKRRVIQKRAQVSSRYMSRFSGYKEASIFKMLRMFLGIFFYPAWNRLNGTSAMKVCTRLAKRLRAYTHGEERAG